MAKYLTKSKFKLALECPTKLYYQSNKEYKNNKLDDDFLKALAKGGFQVGELAKFYYPGGTNIDDLDHDIAVAKTTELLKNDCIIYEAAFRYQNLFIRADIVIKTGSCIQLFEAKAKSIDPENPDETLLLKKGSAIREKWKPYLYDVAFQKYVIQQCYPNLKIKCFLLLVDKSKRTSVDGLNQRFSIKSLPNGRVSIQVVGDVSEGALGEKILSAFPVDEIIDPILIEQQFREYPTMSFSGWIDTFSSALIKNEIVWHQIGSKCSKCEFTATTDDKLKGFKSGFEECWKHLAKFNDAHFNEPSILDLWSFRKKDEYLLQKKYFLSDLTREDLLPKTKPKKSESSIQSNSGMTRVDRQELQIAKAKNKDNSCYVDLAGLESVMNNWNYPFNFIDFETTAVAIPFNKSRRPYEQIAFQFSHHIMNKDGSVEHKNQWINEEIGKFPNFDFVRKLKKALEENTGTIFRYAAHENTILNAIYWQLNSSKEVDREELSNWIKTITKSTEESVEQWEGVRKMVDIKDLVQFYWFHPDAKGSLSIKQILPAILNNSEYLKSKYSKPVYGDLLKSLNFKPIPLIELDNKGQVISPYDKLEPIFKDIPNEILDSLILEEDAELQDGGAAMIAYAQMQFSQMTNEERQRITNSLLRYCELDTMAMVIIVEEWINCIKNSK